IPADGTSSQTYPGTFTVTFSEQVLLTSLEANDLLVDGTPATNFTLLDGNTVTFDIASRETSGDHTYTVTIAAGALESVSGKPIQAFSTSFSTDVTAPVVEHTSVANGAIVGTDPLTISVTFNEPLASAGLGAEDVHLVDADGIAHLLQSFSYDTATNSVALDFGSLAEGNYTLT